MNLEMDINEAVQIIQTYGLNGLVWDFDGCPLKELQNYKSRGDEEFVVVSSLKDWRLATRLFNDSSHGLDPDASDKHTITFSYHPTHYIHVIYLERDLLESTPDEGYTYRDPAGQILELTEIDEKREGQIYLNTYPEGTPMIGQGIVLNQSQIRGLIHILSVLSIKN